MAVVITPGEVPEQVNVVFMRSITGANGDMISKAEIDQISYDVWKVPMTRSRYQELFGDIPLQSRNLLPLTSDQEPECLVNQASLDKDECIFDIPQLDYGWDEDAVGYNFRTTLPAVCFPGIPLANYPDSEWQEIWFRFYPVIGESFVTGFIVNKKFVLAGKSTGTGTGLP